MTALLHRLISAGVLMIWGSALCVIYFSGRISSYLHPTFQPFTIACGCVLVLLAILVLLAPGESETAAHETTRSPSKSVIVAAFLVLPLLVALANSKDGFSATTVLNRNYVQDVSQLPGADANAPVDVTLPTNGTASTPAVSDGESDSSTPEVRRNSKGEIMAEVVDLLYAAQLPDMRSLFENQQIEAIGQLMPAKDDNPHGDRYDLVRMFMTCCAADAQPVALPIQPDAKPGFAEMTWVRISGKATFPVVGGERRPLIENARIEKTDPPEDTFLY